MPKGVDNLRNHIYYNLRRFREEGLQGLPLYFYGRGIF